MNRTCTICLETKSLSEFVNNKTEVEGKGYQCIPCRKKYMKNWRMNNIDKERINGKRSFFKTSFGGLRELVLKRDNYQCIICGITNEEHINKWGRSITIDHIDNMGSTVPKAMKNNTMKNLQTLCFRCHGIKSCHTRYNK